MAKFEIDLRDSNGTPVEFGDTIRVIFPEVEILDSYSGSQQYYLPERIADGVLKFQLSRGILIKITKIYQDENNDLTIGETRKLRHVAWKWFRVAQ